MTLHQWFVFLSTSNTNPMMTSSNGSIFRVTSLLCGEFIGHRWIPRTKTSDTEIWYSLWSAPQQMTKQTVETQVLWGAIAFVMTSPQCFDISISTTDHFSHQNAPHENCFVCLNRFKCISGLQLQRYVFIQDNLPYMLRGPVCYGWTMSISLHTILVRNSPWCDLSSCPSSLWCQLDS